MSGCSTTWTSTAIRRACQRSRTQRAADGLLGAGERVARLDQAVDDLQPFGERGERTLHRVDRDPFEVVETPAEGVVQLAQLAGHRRVAHQPVVGVDRDAEAQATEHADRMVGDRRAHAGVDVRRGAQLQRDAPVAHVRREEAEPLVTGRAGDVVHQAHTVAEPLRAAELHGLPDARQPERFAGVDRGVEVLPAHVLERVQVAGGRVAGLGPGDVESDHAGIAPTDRQLGDLGAARRRAHRREDRVDRQVRAGRAAAEAVHHRLDHLVERQPGLGAQLRGHAHLGVDHAVGARGPRRTRSSPVRWRRGAASRRRCGRTSPGRARGRCAWRRG